MMKVYSNFCDKYIKFKNPRISYFLKKVLGFSTVYSKRGHEHKKVFKEILKILGLLLKK